MAITRPRDAIAMTNGTATPACSFATLPAAASCIVVGWSSWKDSAHTHNSVADNKGGTYTQIGTTVDATGNTRVSLWRRDNISSPSGTFTVTATASSTCDSCLIIAEYAGMASSTLDQNNQGTTTSGTLSIVLSSTTNADDVIVGMCCSTFGTPTITNSPTNLPNLVRESENNATAQCGAMADRIVASTGAYTGSWTISANSGGVVAALKGGVAATKAPPPFRQPMAALLGR